MYAWIVAFHHQKGGAKDDMGNYLAVFVVSSINLVIFLFINSSNLAETLTKNKNEFEFELYKEMFNSLQEGIILVN